jgi:hypothetical protein
MTAFQEELPPNWKTVTSKEGRFTVAMPGTPAQTKKIVKTATGKLQVMMLVAEGRLDSTFVVSYTDYADADLKKGTIDRRLDQARDGAVDSSGGTLRSEKSIDLAGNRGREIVIESDGAVIVRMRIFLVQRRLYQVMVLGAGPIFAPKEKDAGIFLDSFRLIK